MRSSVNKNIAKPLQGVLARGQCLWQAAQLSTFISNDQFGQNQKREVTKAKSDKRNNVDSIRHGFLRRDEESTESYEQTDTNYDKQNAQSQRYYHRSAGDIIESHDMEILPKYNESLNQKGRVEVEIYQDCNNSMPQDQSNSQNEKLKQFTESVIKKIKQGSYINDPRFAYKAVVIQEETPAARLRDENEYAKAILNGIPSNSYETDKISDPNIQNSYANENNNVEQIRMGVSGHNSSVQQMTLPTESSFNDLKSNQKLSMESSKCPAKANTPKPKRKNHLNNETLKESSLDHKNEPMAIQQNPITNNDMSDRKPARFYGIDEEFRSPSYSLRNGFDETDILKCENIAQSSSDRTFHSSTKFSDGKKKNNSERTYTREMNLQETCSNDFPIKPEYPVYKKESSLSDFKKGYKMKSESLQHNQNLETKESPRKEENRVVHLPESDYRENKQVYEAYYQDMSSAGSSYLSREDSKTATNDEIKRSSSDLNYKNVDPSLHTSDIKIEKETLKQSQVINGRLDSCNTYEINNQKQELYNSSPFQSHNEANTSHTSVTADLPNISNHSNSYQFTPINLTSNQTNHSKESCPLKDTDNQKVLNQADVINTKSLLYQGPQENQLKDSIESLKDKVSSFNAAKKPEKSYESRKKSSSQPSTLKHLKPLTSDSHSKAEAKLENAYTSSVNLKNEIKKAGTIKVNNKIELLPLKSGQFKLKINEKTSFPVKEPIKNSAEVLYQNNKIKNSGFLTGEFSKSNLDSHAQKYNKTKSKKPSSDLMSQTPPLKLDFKRAALTEDINKMRNCRLSPPKLVTNKIQDNSSSKKSSSSKIELTAQNMMSQDHSSAESKGKGKDTTIYRSSSVNPTLPGNEIKVKGLKDADDSMSKSKENSVGDETDVKPNSSETQEIKADRVEKDSKTLDSGPNTNNERFVKELQKRIRYGVDPARGSEPGKSDSHTTSSKDSFIRSTQATSMKQANLKSAIIEKQSKDSAAQIQANNEKIANILKEHRILLELLLEKVNSRMPQTPPDYKRGNASDIKTADKSGNALMNNTLISENFRKFFNSTLESQEKVKRLHPRRIERNASEPGAGDEKVREEFKRVYISGGDAASFSKDRPEFKSHYPVPTVNYKETNQYGNTPFKRFKVVTMMTSPSGKCSPKKSTDPLLDGSKLAKYNYSPLKQILSQYRVDATSRPIATLASKSSLGFTKNRKNTFGALSKNGGWRSFSYTAFMKVRGKNDKVDAKPKKLISQIKKITIVNKKKQYNLKDNLKKGHINLKKRTQMDIVNTLKKITKSNEEYNKTSAKSKKNDKIENMAQTVDEPIKEKASKLSVFDSIKREYHNTPQVKLSKPRTNFESYLTNDPVVKDAEKAKKPKNKSLKDVENKIKFIAKPKARVGKFGKTSDGLVTKGPILHLVSSRQMLEGPSWVVSPEYDTSKNHWKFTVRTEREKTIASEAARVGLRQAEMAQSKNTMEYLTSLSRTVILPKILSLTSKPAFPKTLNNTPVLTSSAFPIPSGFFKYKPYKQSESSADAKKKVLNNPNKFPKWFQVDKDYEKEHLSTLSDPEAETLTSVISKCKNKGNRAHVHTSQTYNKPKHNVLRINKNSSLNYKTYTRNYLQVSSLKSKNILETMKTLSFSSKPALLKNKPGNHESNAAQDNVANLNSKASNKCETCEALLERPKRSLVSGLTRLCERIKPTTQVEQFNNKISLPNLTQLKISWDKINKKIKSMLSSSLNNKNDKCCVPNFDEIMFFVSKDIEKKGWQESLPSGAKENPNSKMLKQTRFKELSLILKTNRTSKQGPFKKEMRSDQIQNDEAKIV